MNIYDRTYRATKQAMRKTETIYQDFNADYYYKGYTGNNALSLYLDDKYKINICTSNLAENAFYDAVNNR